VGVFAPSFDAESKAAEEKIFFGGEGLLRTFPPSGGKLKISDAQVE
jgi:hypothetical protein